MISLSYQMRGGESLSRNSGRSNITGGLLPKNRAYKPINITIMFSYSRNKFSISPGAITSRLDWGIFLLVAIAIRALFFEMSWYSYFAILISIREFMLLFLAIGKVVPVRYMFGSLMCLQMLIGPVFAYNGLDKFQYEYYTMKIPEV